MVWYSRNSAGLWDAYIGNGSCQGKPLLPPYAGNRGPADMTSDGRYVLLTTAVGWDKSFPWAAPGRGSQNAIQLYDRVTGRLSTLLGSGTSSQRGVIWPKLSPDGTKIAWSQMVRTAMEVPPNGQWALHVANVNLETGTLSNNVEWQDPNGEAAFYEAYGWIPGTHLLVFMSGTRSTSTNFKRAQLFTLPDSLNPASAPTRISPKFAPAWPWQSPVDVFHEFAAFAPGAPNILYTSIGADTLGGDDLFSYDLRTQQPGGLLGQPTRISYFGGDLNLNWGSAAIPGWPTPSYTVVTSMAWVGGGWVATTCPEMLCETFSAWRINTGTSAPLSAQSAASARSGLADGGVSRKGARHRCRSARAARRTPAGTKRGSSRRSCRHASAGHRSTPCRGSRRGRCTRRR
jgi:hypothetical protein